MKTTNRFLMSLCSTALFSIAAYATDDQTTTAYNLAKDTAEANYKAAHQQCQSLAGNGKDVCLAQADATRVHDISNAEAKYKNTPRALASAQRDIANANFALAEAKCGSLAGNDKDVCIKQAEAVKISQIADANAAQRTSEARADANDAKRDADYATAKEKCDALAGSAKDACLSNAKAKYGK